MLFGRCHARFITLCAICALSTRGTEGRCDRDIYNGTLSLAGYATQCEGAAMGGFTTVQCKPSGGLPTAFSINPSCVSMEGNCVDTDMPCDRALASEAFSTQFSMGCAGGLALRSFTASECTMRDGVTSLRFTLRCCAPEEAALAAPTAYRSDRCASASDSLIDLLSAQPTATQCPEPDEVVSGFSIARSDDPRCPEAGVSAELECSALLRDVNSAYNASGTPAVGHGRTLPRGDNTMTNAAVAVGVGSAVTLSPVSLGAFGVLLLLSSLQCNVDGNATEAEPIDWQFHPCHEPLGGHAHRYYVGAVVFNTLFLLFAFTLAHVASFLRWMQTSSSVLIVLPLLFLLPGTVTSASTLAFFYVNAPIGAGVLGSLVLTAWFATVFLVWKNVLRKARFNATTVGDSSATSRFYRFVFGSELWATPTSTSSFLDKHRMWFEPYRVDCPRFLLCELLLISFIAMVSVWRPTRSSLLPCTLRNIAMSAALAGFAAALLWHRPFISPFQNGAMIAVYSALSVAMLCIALSLPLAPDGRGGGDPPAGAEAGSEEPFLQHSVLSGVAKGLFVGAAYFLAIKTILEVVLHFVEGRGKRHRSSMMVADNEDRPEGEQGADDDDDDDSNSNSNNDGRCIGGARGNAYDETPLISDCHTASADEPFLRGGASAPATIVVEAADVQKTPLFSVILPVKFKHDNETAEADGRAEDADHLGVPDDTRLKLGGGGMRGRQDSHMSARTCHSSATLDTTIPLREVREAEEAEVEEEADGLRLSDSAPEGGSKRWGVGFRPSAVCTYVPPVQGGLEGDSQRTTPRTPQPEEREKGLLREVSAGPELLKQRAHTTLLSNLVSGSPAADLAYQRVTSVVLSSRRSTTSSFAPQTSNLSADQTQLIPLASGSSTEKSVPSRGNSNSLLDGRSCPLSTLGSPVSPAASFSQSFVAPSSPVPIGSRHGSAMVSPLASPLPRYSDSLVSLRHPLLSPTLSVETRLLTPAVKPLSPPLAPPRSPTSEPGAGFRLPL